VIFACKPAPGVALYWAMTRRHWSFALLFGQFCGGCGGAGALSQSRMTDAADPKRNDLHAPLAVGSSYRPEMKVELRGGGVPSLILDSPRSQVLSVQDGTLFARSPGLAAVLVKMPDGTTIDFLHIWVAAPTQLTLHRFSQDFSDLGAVTAPLDLVAGESVLLTPRIYAGAQRLAGNAESTWRVEPPLLDVLSDGVPERRRLVARAPGLTKVTVSMLGTSTSIELRVVP
jgi:hypothetical protein